ncbi:MAG TPA: methyltransferase domain-containing protein [Stellaceae bacterium]|nr:methyltransferase domain-containing protein [Stellaceae bacterium]
MTGLPLVFPAQAAADDPPPVLAALRPSEYTAALIQGLRARAAWVRDANALEIGSGSGVVLAALGKLGAASLCGVDIESAAVACGAVLLHGLGYGKNAEMHHGDMWLPVAGRRFDLITANLPHFPMEPVEFAGRLPSWSSGGSDGRRLLDRFLGGVEAHLAPGGRAIITHNGCIDLELSRALVGRAGLSLRVAATVLIHVPGEKLDLMTGSVLRAEEGRSIHRYGPYAFAEMHIVEIGALSALN